MKALPALSLAIAATLALGGCGKNKAPDNATAGGQILPRSASDDMLPYDTVTSEPELSNPDAGITGSHPRAHATASADENEDVVTSDEAPPPGAAEAPPATPVDQ